MPAAVARRSVDTLPNAGGYTASVIAHAAHAPLGRSRAAVHQVSNSDGALNPIGRECSWQASRRRAQSRNSDQFARERSNVL